jgi:hypothetical protein
VPELPPSFIRFVLNPQFDRLGSFCGPGELRGEQKNVRREARPGRLSLIVKSRLIRKLCYPGVKFSFPG